MLRKVSYGVKGKILRSRGLDLELYFCGGGLVGRGLGPLVLWDGFLPLRACQLS